MKFCYSLNDENFDGDYDTREEALNAGVDMLEGQGTVWVGKVVPAIDYLSDPRTSYRCADSAIEYLEEVLGENMAWDDRILNLTDHQMAGLGAIIVDYLRQNVQITRFGVKEVEEHSISASSVNE